MQLKPCQCCSDQNRTIAISQSPPEVQLCVRTSEIRSKENNGLCHHKQDVGQVLSHLPILHISLCHTFDNIAKTPPGERFEPKLKLFSRLKHPSYIFVRDLSATPTLCVFAHSRLWRKTLEEILDKYSCTILFLSKHRCGDDKGSNSIEKVQNWNWKTIFCHQSAISRICKNISI